MPAVWYPVVFLWGSLLGSLLQMNAVPLSKYQGQKFCLMYPGSGLLPT
jgi:hypothetical protein